MGFLQGLISKLLKDVIFKAFDLLVTFIKKQAELAKAKQQAKKKTKEIMKEKDPTTRAKRMKDFLNS